MFYWKLYRQHLQISLLLTKLNICIPFQFQDSAGSVENYTDTTNTWSVSYISLQFTPLQTAASTTSENLDDFEISFLPDRTIRLTCKTSSATLANSKYPGQIAAIDQPRNRYIDVEKRKCQTDCAYLCWIVISPNLSTRTKKGRPQFLVLFYLP